MDETKMSAEQCKNLKNLEFRIIALTPILGLYTILKTFLDLIKECQNVNEIDGKIKQLEYLVKDAEKFFEDMQGYIQMNIKPLVKKG
jgi:hypothetical protein